MSCAPPDCTTASPRTTRSTSISERRPLAPVTPQRTNRAYKMRSVTSPLTPSSSSVISSPFTPITNVYSSASSLISPNSSVSTKVDFSPESAKSKAKSVADATSNWRSRAKENGRKIDDERYPDADTLSSSKEIIPASFLSTHRRSRQSLFQTSSADSTAFTSPMTARMPVAADGDTNGPALPVSNLSLLNTPEAVRTLSRSFTLATPSPRTSLAIVQKLRQRGSLTDPVRPRRRQFSGPIMGEALFDIDEDAPASSPYPEAFGSPFSVATTQESFSASAKRCVSAPFIAARFYEGYDDDGDDEFEDDGLPNAPKSSRLRATKSVSSLPLPAPAKISTGDRKSGASNNRSCSVCSACSSPLSTLIPCGHLICSSCLTGALNIIGEKDMRCAACDKPVDDFKLLSPLKLGIAVTNDAEKGVWDDGSGSFKEDSTGLLPSAFDELSINNDNGARNKVKFESESQERREPATPTMAHEAEDVTVLRIDNVPWDITPPSLAEFFTPYIAVRSHVLLDSKGKTLSHAYVEVPSVDARNALRAVQNKSLGRGKRLRGVTVTMSSQGELMRALFPSWLGGFEGMHPTLDGLDHPTMVRTLENGLITLPEIDGLVALMKNPKSHFLKVPTLPFYTLVSILSKFPVDSDSRVFYSGKLRDVLYDLTNAACDLLVERIKSVFHDQRTLDTVVSTAINSKVFTDTQRSVLNARIVDAIAAKGGQLSFTPAEFRTSPSTSITTSPRSDDSLTPEDSVSLASATSGRGGRDHRSLGYGRPSMMRRNENTFPFANAAPFANSPQALYTPLASPHINAPPGFNYGNMGLGMAYPMNNTPQGPYDVLAREFGIGPDVVAALVQRLAYTGPSVIPTQSIGGYAFTNGHM